MLAILPLILSIAPEIARWIGGSQAGNVTTAVANVVKTVTGKDDPQEAAAALAADPAKAAELRVELAKISANAEAAQRQVELDELKAQFAAEAAARQAQLDTFKASIGDIQSARSQSVELAKAGSPMAWGAPVLSFVIVVSFATMLYYVVTGKELLGNNLSIANVLLGTLAAMATQVANYWLGSSSGSRSKDALLSDAQTKLAASVPSGLVQGPGSVSIVNSGGPGAASDLSANDLNALSLSRARN